jgi:hypothetical protein
LCTTLNKNSCLSIQQEKWKRVLSKSAIYVNLEKYTLQLSESKRELIFNSWGDLIDTLPLLLVDGVLTKRPPTIIYYLPFITILKQLPIFNQLYLPYFESNEIIYLPPSLPRVIYVKPSLPAVFYFYPSDSYHIAGLPDTLLYSGCNSCRTLNLIRWLDYAS